MGRVERPAFGRQRTDSQAAPESQMRGSGREAEVAQLRKTEDIIRMEPRI